MKTTLEVLETPIVLDSLDPQFAYVEGQFLYVDKITGKLIPNKVMEEYNKHFGYHGYDEDNRDQEIGECDV